MAAVIQSFVMDGIHVIVFFVVLLVELWQVCRVISASFRENFERRLFALGQLAASAISLQQSIYAIVNYFRVVWVTGGVCSRFELNR